jgi:GT2 family glycosyltransferase
LETLEVGAVGAGALLVKRNVFQRIKKELGEAPFQITEGLSEDYSFCRRCRILGIPITLALNVEAHHVTRNVLSVVDYRAQGELKEVQSRGGAILEG